MPRYHDLKNTENDPALLDRALRYLAEKEGFVARPQLDPNGKQYNIGYGSKIDTSNPTWKKRSITQTEAKELLKDDFLRHRGYAKQALLDAGYTKPSGRLLDGLGLLFFNTNWNKLAESKRFKDAAKTAQAGNEDPLITFAQGIDTVNGKWDEGIAARRTAESKYMMGEQLPVREQNARAKLQWNQTPTPIPAAATPTPSPLPTGVAASREGPSIFDRLKKYGEDAADFAFGTKFGQKRQEQDTFAKFAEGKSKDTPKPTPSTPLAAAEKEEPAPTKAAIESELDRPEVHDQIEKIKRAGAKMIADAVLDPELLNSITAAQKESGKTFEQELMGKIWEANHPGKPVPENITEVDLPIASAISPRKTSYEEEMEPYSRAVDESYARTRDLVRRKMAEKRQPYTAPSSLTPP